MWGTGESAEAYLVACGAQLLQGEHTQDKVLVIQEGVCAAWVKAQTDVLMQGVQ